MYTHFSQTSVQLPDSNAVLARLEIPSGLLRCSPTNSGLETTLDFDGGQAIVRSSGRALFLWVAAENILILWGIRTALEATILAISRHAVSRAVPPTIRWFCAGATPFV